MDFEVRAQESFYDSRDKLEKTVKERVDKVVRNKLAKDPYRGAGNKGHLKGKYHGLRRIWVGRSGYRIIFSICEECRRLGYDKYIRCVDCDEIPNKTVKLFLVGPRPRVYR